MKRVLVTAPIYEGMEYCFSNFIEHVKEIDYKHFDVLIVDNSKTKKFFRKIKEVPEIKVTYDETTENENLKRLVSSRNKIIDYAIDKNYDSLLMLDSDLMVPKDILNRLISTNKDVVSGLYFNFFNFGGKPELLPVAYNSITEREFEALKQKGGLPEEVKSKEDIRRHLNKEELQKKEILEALYPCGGCLFLSREAFTSGAKYGLLETKEKTSDDIYFFKELRKRGFKMNVIPSLICKHDLSNKYKEGIHPLDKKN